MIALDYQGRYTPCFEATLDELIEAVECYPMHDARRQPPGRREGWLYLSTFFFPAAYQHAAAKSVHYYAKVKPGLVEMIGRRSIFETDGMNLPEHHGLEICERNNEVFLAVKFQLVSGSYTLVRLDRQQILDLLNKAREAM